MNSKLKKISSLDKTYKIVVKDRNRRSLFIDTTVPVAKNIKPSYGIVLDEPQMVGGILMKALFFQNVETARALGFAPSE